MKIQKRIQDRVLLINQSAGYLMVDIVNAYAQKYSDVVLLTGSYNTQDRELNKSVKIHKIAVYIRSSFFMRALTWLIATLQIFFLLLWKYRHYKIIYVTNPPMSYFPSLILKCQYSIIVYDVYPNALNNIGIYKSSWMYKVWVKINKRIYRAADKVYTLSNGMATLLLEYCDENKIEVIRNWAGIESLQRIDKAKNPFIREHNLFSKFVVMYSGNIGFTHNVESIIEIAEVLRTDEDIVFLIIGEGLKKNELMLCVKEKALKNCCFLSWQDSKCLKYSLSAADISIITLTDETALASVPSKTYNLLGIGSPLLCIAPDESELALLVKEYHCGRCFSKNDVSSMADFIKKLKADSELWKVYSNNSLKASLNYTYKNAEQYVS